MAPRTNTSWHCCQMKVLYLPPFLHFHYCAISPKGQGKTMCIHPVKEIQYVSSVKDNSAKKKVLFYTTSVLNPVYIVSAQAYWKNRRDRRGLKKGSSRRHDDRGRLFWSSLRCSRKHNLLPSAEADLMTTFKFLTLLHKTRVFCQETTEVCKHKYKLAPQGVNTARWEVLHQPPTLL